MSELSEKDNKKEQVEDIAHDYGLEAVDFLLYLDELRESGQVNMLGAGEYLMDDFGMDKKEARIVLRYWMRTFSERHA